MAAKPPPTTTTTGCDAGGELLPLDAVFNIFLWLPVMSLLRFKSVCKSWRSLIESSIFVHQHLHHAATNINLMVMNRRHIFYDSGARALNFSILSGEEFQVAVDVDLPGFSKLRFKSIYMIPCNGIICLYNYYICYINRSFVVDVALWNPATKQLCALPQSPFPLPLIDNYIEVHIPIGFGLDVKTNDYKVARFCVFTDEDLEDKECEVDVYNLTTDSWRNIITTFPIDINWIGVENTTPCLNGFCCWVGRYIIYSKNVIVDTFIVSFDLSNEVFGTMPLPDNRLESTCLPHLAVLKDKIACINTVIQHHLTHVYEIWVLNEYGVKESWSRLYKIGPLKIGSFSQTEQTGLLNNGDFLLVRNSLLCIYDLVTHEIKNLPVKEVLQSHAGILRNGSLQVVEYKESLISVKGGSNATNRVTCAETLRVKDEELQQLARDILARVLTIKEITVKLSDTLKAAESTKSAEQRRMACTELVRLANESEKQLQTSMLKLRASEENDMAVSREKDELVKQINSVLSEVQLCRSEFEKATERVVLLEDAFFVAEKRAKVAEADAEAKEKEAVAKRLTAVKEKEELLAYINVLQEQVKSRAGK